MSDAKITLAIFDMDGLMLDTESVSLLAWNEVNRRFGIEIPKDVLESLYGCNREVCRQRMTKALGETFRFDEAIEIHNAFSAAYTDAHGVALKPGLLEMLGFLDENKIRKCVATSTGKARARHLLSQIGIAERFDHIIGGDEIKNGKPDPEIFLKSAAAFHKNPSECIVLEDSIAGIEAAYKGGFHSICIPDLAQPDSITRERASAVCANLLEAIAYMKKFI
ncbi:MAG: HAD family phosphatase [Clostridiales bacterium]|jgi:HAD superfamily hydrolase (TIGR01509 family)|nr:HAD family phosphatase [Clostridiales bacterium]